MHNNYYFLRQLSRELEVRLKGSVVSACFSQSKDELVIRFETHSTPFFLKASLLSNFSCLSFPENFQRAKKNSADIFDELIGQRLRAVEQYENERAFAFVFEEPVTLLFKMHGNLSNIILFNENNVTQLFKNNLQADAGINLQALARSIDWSYESFVANQHTLNSLYFTFGKTVWQYLSGQHFEAKTIEEKWRAIQDVKKILLDPVYYIAHFNSRLLLTLLPVGEILKEHSTAIQATTDFYHRYSQDDAFTREKHSHISSLKTTLQNYESYIEKTFTKLAELENDNNYKIWADLIMANLQAIPPRSEKVTLLNFYNHDLPTEIKLKKDYSPQKNAEIFYRKSKNQHIEIDRLRKALQDKEKEANTVRKKIEILQSATDLKSLRAAAISLHLSKEKEKQPELLPYHDFEFQGYKIWVGRNAQSNDQLTLKYAFKEDLWLHAKDVAGSHVILKYQSGKPFPKDVIERAAQLAAYNSKRKNESLCPVVVTPKKFVRKRKGDPPGAMIVEREDVIMVEPKK